jgi:hypothetical protein
MTVHRILAPPGSGSGTTGSVAAIASNAAWLMAIRITSPAADAPFADTRPSKNERPAALR